ncbi:hypothetical protein BC828DRAFT_414454 [Blastocladiella britannica]|nr:hypothetical protein BC828DRAFT_414454 [Blastocladiella britannica]
MSAEGRELATGGGANRWKFKSFNDLIKTIRIDVKKTSLARNAMVDDGDAPAAADASVDIHDSHFVNAIAAWQELNCTEHFSQFVRQVMPMTQSLTLVIHHKDTLVAALLHHLAVKDSLALEPLLDLIVMLAKDLRQDLFSDLGAIIRAIHPILRIHDAKTVAHGFQAVALLLQYLEKSVLKAVPAVYDMLAPLLGRGHEQKAHVRQFAAESMSFLLRKLKRRELVTTVVAHILSSVDNEPPSTVTSYATAVGRLFAETVNHVSRTMHSCTAVMLATLLRESLSVASAPARDTVVCSTISAILFHTTVSTNKPLFTALVEAWSIHPARGAAYIQGTIPPRGGTLVPSFSALMDAFARIVVPLEHPPAEAVALFASLLVHASYEDVIKRMTTLERVVVHPGVSLDALLEFHRALLRDKYESYTSVVLPLTVRFLTTNWRNLDQDLVLAFLADVLSHATLLHSSARSIITPAGKLMFDADFPVLEVLHSYEQQISSADNDRRVVAAVAVATKLDIAPADLQAALISVLGATLANSKLFSHALDALLSQRLVNADVDRIVAQVPVVECPYLVTVLASYLQASSTLTADTRAAWVAKLVCLVSSQQHIVRQPVLASLSFLRDTDELIGHCAKAESIGISLEAHRAKAMHLKNLGLSLGSATAVKSKSSISLEVVSRYALALFTVNFAPLWPQASDLVVKVLGAAPDAIWPLMSSMLLRFQHRDSIPDLVTSVVPAIDTLDPSTATTALQFFAESCFNMPVERVDHWNVYLLVLKALSGHTFTESRSKFFVPLFLQFVRDEYYHFHRDLKLDIDPAAAPGTTDLSFDEPSDPLTVTYPIATKKMAAFLELFSHLKPSSVFKADVLYSLYLQLLTRGDAEMQRSALKCIQSYKLDWYTPYHDLFMELLDETKFRGTLQKVSLDGVVEEQTFREHHRAAVFPIYLRLLYGRILCRKGTPATRRSAILSHLAASRDSEIATLFHLMCPISLEPGTIDMDVVRSLDVGRAAGFATLMEDVIKQISRRLECIIVPLLDLFVSVACSTTLAIREREEEDRMDVSADAEDEANDESDQDDDEKEVDDEEDKDSTSQLPTLKRLHGLRQLAMRRLVTLFKLDIPLEDYTPYTAALFEVIIAPQLPVMFHENKSALSASLQLLAAWAVHHFEAFQEIAPTALAPMIACLVGFERARTLVLDSLFAVLEHGPELLQPVTGYLFEQSAPLINTKSVGAMWRLIKLCSALAPHVPAEQAPLLVAVLLPVLTAPRASAATKADILSILESCIPHLPQDHVRNVFLTTSRLYTQLDTQSARNQLVLLTTTLSTALGLRHVSKIVQGLNQPNRRRFEELDYDVVLNTFVHVNKVSGKLSSLEWIAVLYNLFHLIRSDDLSVRGNSSHTLVSFVTLAASRSAQSQLGATENGMDLSDNNDHGEESLKSLVHHVLYPAFKSVLKAHVNEPVRVEWFKVLNACVREMSDLTIFSDMTCLLPSDAADESGFFDNVHHIQMHRRLRALARLRDQIPSIRPSTLNYIFLPLMTHIMEHKDGNLAAEAIVTVTTIAKYLPWGSYNFGLRRFFNQLRAATEKRREKLLMKVVVAFLDGFHFEIADAIQAPAAVAVAVAVRTDANKAGEDDADEEDESAAEAEAEAEDSVAALQAAANDHKLKVLHAVTFKIIPELFKYLMSRKQSNDDSMSVRIPIALGITYLITYLPEEAKRVQIPSLLTKLAQLLRSRAQSTRNATRQTLVSIMQTLGSRYLFFMIKELKGALLRGYQLHVLGFTVHAIVANIPLSPACLDACAADLCEVVGGDIFGEVGDEKDAEAYTKTMKELKACASFDTVELMAAHASANVISKLLIQVKRVLTRTREASTLDKVKRVLKRMTNGIVKNQDLTVEQMMQLVHALVADTFVLANGDRLETTADLIQTAHTETTRVLASTSTWKSNAHFFVEFGLHLLQTVVRSPRLDVANPEHTKMLNALVDVVGQCFGSKHNATYSLALYAMQHMCRLPLSQLRETLPLVLQHTFATLSSMQDVRSDIGQASLKLVQAIMQSCSYVPFTQKYVKLLLRLLRPEISDHDTHTVTYSVLKSIIARQIVVEEVYDMSSEIAHIMVTSHSVNVQDLCRSVMLLFLLNYPQGKQRMDTHVAWMLKNLNYEFEQGRVSVLELIHGFIKKLPEDLLVEYGQLLFVGLVTSLTDESPKCQEMAARLVQLLLAKLLNLHPVIKMVASWYKADATRAVATQVHGLLILANRESPVLLALLKDQLDLVAEMSKVASAETIVVDEKEPSLDDDEKPDPANNTEWKLVYLTLLTLTKYITQRPQQTEIDVVQALLPHFVHPHAWVRLAAARCLGQHFSALAECDLDVEATRTVIREVTRQLSSQFLNQDLATQIVKNLYYLCKHLHSLAPAVVVSSSSMEVDGQDEEEDLHEDDADLEDDDDEEKVAAASSSTTRRKQRGGPLLSTLNYLSYLARRDQSRNKGTLVRMSLFQVFAALSNHLPASELEPVLSPIMAPIFRTHQDDSVKGPEWDELRKFCQELMDMLQGKLGQDAFTRVYADVRSRAESKRQQRKQDRAELAVTNPQAYATRKIARNELKKKQKKRRTEEEMATKMRTDVKRAKTKH